MPDRKATTTIRTRILHRRIFSRPLFVTALYACSLFASVSLAAQEELPQIMPGERKVPSKKDNGPRAVALLQLGSNGKTSLLPIAIMINGKFWDASAYKADPVPMALDSGNVYEVERTGSSQGLFTVAGALHSNSPNAQTPWLATGSWVPSGSEKPKSGAKANITPVGIDTVDAPPRLSRNSSASNMPAPGSNTPAPASNPPASTPESKPSSGDEPPRLSRPASSSQPESAPSSPQGDSKGSSGSNPPSSSQPASAPPQPNAPGSPQPASAPAQQKDHRAANVPASDSDTPEANRPRLRRGKPAESFADEDDIPGYSKPGASSSVTAAPAGKAQPAASTPPPQWIPAVSDAAGPEPRSFAFEWLKDEESQRHQQMLDLAKQQMQTYLKAQTKATTTSTPQAHHATAHAPAHKLPEPVFENVKMTAYDLWVTNQPVLVLSADAHLPPAPNQPADAPTPLQYSVTVVAYPDIYNNMHKLYSGITDKYHLDLTPRLELIDAVDADGDGRGELLFREISDAGTGWIIYRATADTLWKMYDSLNPE